jgi:hypothetical protein
MNKIITDLINLIGEYPNLDSVQITYSTNSYSNHITFFKGEENCSFYFYENSGRLLEVIATVKDILLNKDITIKEIKNIKEKY